MKKSDIFGIGAIVAGVIGTVCGVVGGSLKQDEATAAYFDEREKNGDICFINVEKLNMQHSNEEEH